MKRLLAYVRGGGVIGAFLAVVLGLVLLWSPAGRSLRDASYDLPFLLLRTGSTNTNIVIIQLDDVTFTDLQQNPASFDRAIHAEMLDKLARVGASAVVFDILFLDRGSAESDQRLATAAARLGHVVVGAEVFKRMMQGVPSFVLERPKPPLDSIPWGLVKISEGSDRTPRQHHPGTDRFPSLAWRALQLPPEPKDPPADREKERWLNYYGPHPFLRIPYSEFFMHPDHWARDLTNRIVFIGRSTDAGYAGEEKDEFRSPWTFLDKDFIYGVEVHALTLANLLGKDWIERKPGAAFGLILLCGLLAGYTLPLMRPWLAALVALTLAGAVSLLAAGAQLLWNRWVPWLIPVAAQIPAALLWAVLYSSVQAYVEKRNLEHSLGLHLSPERARQIARRRELLSPGAQAQTVSILFSDIQNFSTICDRTRLDEMIELLNKYFEAVIPCVKNTQGTVLKLIGDAVFAVWNAPEPQANHAELACRAALRLRESLVDFEAGNENFRLKTRVGLHSGEVSIGNFGSKERFDYTAIGANVNLAARLEGLNKHLGTDILLSDDLLGQVREKFATRAVGHFRFKGLDRVIRIYELLGPADRASESAPWRGPFKEALRNFCDGHFVEAERGFREVLDLRPNDGPSKFYLKLAGAYQKEPPRDWMGEVKMDEK